MVSFRNEGSLASHRTVECALTIHDTAERFLVIRTVLVELFGVNLRDPMDQRREAIVSQMQNVAVNDSISLLLDLLFSKVTRDERSANPRHHTPVTVLTQHALFQQQAGQSTCWEMLLCPQERKELFDGLEKQKFPSFFNSCKNCSTHIHPSETTPSRLHYASGLKLPRVKNTVRKISEQDECETASLFALLVEGDIHHEIHNCYCSRI